MATLRSTLRPAVRTTLTRVMPKHNVIPSYLPFIPSYRSSTPSPMSLSQTRNSTYAAPTSDSQRKRVTIQTLRNLYRKGEPITMLTAHDFPSAHVADSSGMDMILVGDSLGMFALGLDDTSEVVLEEMVLHCRSVARAAKSSFIVGDMPMGSYEVCSEQAVQSALRIIKEGRVHAVKLEGGAELAPTIQRITQAGVPVVGHVGLTPQRQNSLGGFRVQGKTTSGALKVLNDAAAMQAAGAFMIVLEALPPQVASIITQKLSVPTIGIGAGSDCSGQVLVQVDMTANFQPGRFVPKFVKQYADVWGEAARGIAQYRSEVKSRAFPSPEYTYPVSEDVLTEIEKSVDGVVPK